MASDKQKLENVFYRACQIADPKESAQYLDRACAGDPKLRLDVEGVLNSHEKASRFLEKPAIESQRTLDQAPVTEQIGSSIGPYKLLEKIGEGGMAVVYMA